MGSVILYLDRVDRIHDGVLSDSSKGTGEQTGIERRVLGQSLVFIVFDGVLGHGCDCFEWGREEERKALLRLTRAQWSLQREKKKNKRANER